MLPLEDIEGKYEILQMLQEGGMGAVYKVRHILLEEIRVIKVVRPQLSDSADYQERFLREARAAIRLRHQNIAQLYDFSVDANRGTAYMVIEYIDGLTLRQLLKKVGRPPVAMCLHMAIQGLSALSFLHHQGYVHRDIAPDNLMLTADFDGEPMVKLIDMGIVKHLEEKDAGLTDVGTFLGKAKYSSPEQFQGDSNELGPPSDLYSFGVMLYELLTGEHPMRGKTVTDLIAAHLFQEPRPFSETDPEGLVPEPVREIVMQAMQKKADDRFATAIDFAQAIKPHLIPGSLRDETTFVLRSSDADADQTVHVAGTSTQGRLNEQFGLNKTPAPTSSGAAELSSVASGPSEASDLLRHAKELMQKSGLHDKSLLQEARSDLYKALAINPEDNESRGALREVESTLEHIRLKEEQQVAAKEAEAERLCSQARSELDGGQPNVAIKLLEDALQELPERPATKQLLDEARAALERLEAERAAEKQRQAEAERQQQIQATLGEIRQQLQAGDLTSAENGLAMALAKFGNLPELDTVGEELVEAKTKVEIAAERERLEHAKGELERARAAGSSEVITEAIARLRQQAPRHTVEEYAALIVQLESERDKLAAEQGREEQRQNLARDVEARIEAGELTLARGLHEQLAGLGADDAVLEALDGRLTQALELRTAHRAKELAEAASKLVVSGDLGQAQQALDAALAELGSRPEFESVSSELDAARKAASKPEAETQTGKAAPPQDATVMMPSPTEDATVMMTAEEAQAAAAREAQAKAQEATVMMTAEEAAAKLGGQPGGESAQERDADTAVPGPPPSPPKKPSAERSAKEARQPEAQRSQPERKPKSSGKKKGKKKKAAAPAPTPKPAARAEAPAKPAPAPKPARPASAPSTTSVASPPKSKPPIAAVAGGLLAVAVIGVGIVMFTGGADDPSETGGSGQTSAGPAGTESPASSSSSGPETRSAEAPVGTQSPVATQADPPTTATESPSATSPRDESTSTASGGDTDSGTADDRTSTGPATTQPQQTQTREVPRATPTPTVAVATERPTPVPTTSTIPPTTTTVAPTTTSVRPTPTQARPTPQAQPTQAPARPAAADPEVTAIQSRLNSYAAAWQSLDLNAIKESHPSVPLRRRDLNNFKSYSVNISGCNIDVSGSSAVARCSVSRNVTLSNGQTQTVNGSGFRLSKQGGNWVVAELLQ